jgi:hypothetical protein
MKELIEELRNRAMHLTDIGVFDTPVLLIKAAKALERLTTGDVELPEPYETDFSTGEQIKYFGDWQLKDYGDRRAAAAVLAEHERMLNTLTRHDLCTSNIWRHYYPSATGDYVDLRELRKVLAPNAKITGRASGPG